MVDEEEFINTSKDHGGQSIASRREKRLSKKQQDSENYEESQPSNSAPEGKKVKKNMENGWYKVEGITGHRLNTEGKRVKFELRVKWEGYTEQTWEAFDGFVKDTAPMVERYLIRNILKPLI